MILRLLDEAKEEMRESALWYENKRTGLGDDFLDAVKHAFELIETHPRRFKPMKTRHSDREVRRVLLKRFPYMVVYEIRVEETLIVAVAHGKRKPRYWQHRLE